MAFIFPYTGNFIIPTDKLIFFRGVGIPPTRDDLLIKHGFFFTTIRPRTPGFDEARRVRPPRAVLRAHYQLLGLEEGANASEAKGNDLGLGVDPGWKPLCRMVPPSYKLV